MAERTQYAPGTFSWADLATTDPDAAKSFYCDLFGWQAEDMPVGDGTYYSMMRIDGKDVAAIAPQPPPQREAGVPPMWQSYVTVESADTVAERVNELGGTVHAGPFDVLDAGRMAVIQDPQGAFFMAWEPRRHFGAARVNESGTLVWNELSSPDLEGSAAFYRDLFGWTIAPFEGSPEPYLSIKNADANNGGIRELSPEGIPPHWLVYFGCDEIEAALAKVEQRGGTKIAGPIDIGMAKIGIVQDPQGAAFALYDGALEP